LPEVDRGFLTELLGLTGIESEPAVGTIAGCGQGRFLASKKWFGAARAWKASDTEAQPKPSTAPSHPRNDQGDAEIQVRDSKHEIAHSACYWKAKQKP